MKCTLVRTQETIASQVELANTFWARLKGLMFRRALAPGSALLLEPCPQIHTCFMRFSIDVVFLDKSNQVVAVLEPLKPWRMSKLYRASCRALELPCGTLKGRIHTGDELVLD